MRNFLVVQNAYQIFAELRTATFTSDSTFQINATIQKHRLGVQNNFWMSKKECLGVQKHFWTPKHFYNVKLFLNVQTTFWRSTQFRIQKFWMSKTFLWTSKVPSFVAFAQHFPRFPHWQHFGKQFIVPQWALERRSGVVFDRFDRSSFCLIFSIGSINSIVPSFGLALYLVNFNLRIEVKKLVTITMRQSKQNESSNSCLSL